MRDLSKNQRQTLMTVIVIVDLLVVALLVMSFLGWTNLPIFIPLLLLVASSGLLVAIAARRSAP